VPWPAPHRGPVKDRLVLDGLHPALLVQGDDELGALAELHMKLMNVNKRRSLTTFLWFPLN
jgi:hypothetical protein